MNHLTNRPLHAPATAPHTPARDGARAPSNPARVLTARAQKAALAAVTTSRKELARAHGLEPPTVYGWFGRLTLSLRTLDRLGRLVGLSPAAMLLSDEEREMLERVYMEFEDQCWEGHVEALNNFLHGSGA